MTTLCISTFDIPIVCEHLSNLDMQKNPVLGENSAFLCFIGRWKFFGDVHFVFFLFSLKAMATELQDFKMLVCVHIL